MSNTPAICTEIAKNMNHKIRRQSQVDKHFNDNWIITLYMGHVVNLRKNWAPYKAASTALKNSLKLTVQITQ